MNQQNIQTNNQIIGAKGELLALNFIKQEGFSLIAKNYKSRYGELDLILQKGNVISFTEVKSRVSNNYLSTQLISKKKMHSIITTAKNFILEFNLKSSDYIFRFDVALVHIMASTHNINYIPNAFFA